MSFRLIERKGDATGVTPDNDALLNYEALGRADGRLYGFEIGYSNGYVTATKGRISIRGFTFEATGTENLYNIASYSTATTSEYTLYLRVDYDASTRDASYDYEVRPSSETLTSAEIEKNVSGSAYLALFAFSKSGGTVSNWSDRLSDISSLSTRVAAAETELDTKQGVLTSGQNIRTVNGYSLLGSGNIAIGTDGETVPSLSATVPYAQLNNLDSAIASGGSAVLYLDVEVGMWPFDASTKKWALTLTPDSQTQDAPTYCLYFDKSAAMGLGSSGSWSDVGLLTALKTTYRKSTPRMALRAYSIANVGGDRQDSLELHIQPLNMSGALDA